MTLPWVNIDNLHVQFSDDVGDVTAADVALHGVNVPDYAIASVSYDATKRTATILLGDANTPIAADKLRLIVKDTVTDLDGSALDGEWTDAESTVSGDGTAGGDLQFRFNVLPGNVVQDSMVFANDAAIVLSKQLTTPASANYSIFADVDGSGFIFANDAAQVLARQLTALPTMSPASLSKDVPKPVRANPDRSVVGKLESSASDLDLCGSPQPGYRRPPMASSRSIATRVGVDGEVGEAIESIQTIDQAILRLLETP